MKRITFLILGIAVALMVGNVATAKKRSHRSNTTVSANDKIVNSYLKKVREFRSTEEGEGGVYFLYDITNDGVPELWASSTFGYGSMYVYTYTKGKLKLIYQGSGGHATYHRGNGYVIEHMAHMGYGKIIKLTYRKGKIVEKTLLEEEIGPDQNYRNPKEPEFDVISLTEEAPIRSMF